MFLSIVNCCAPTGPPLPWLTSSLQPFQRLTHWQLNEISSLDIFILRQEDMLACEGNGKETVVF